MIRTLAEAIAYAHAEGVVHRDLKPANILLLSGGVVSGESCETPTDHSPLTSHQPKITDFGVAKCADGDGEALGLRSPTATGEVLGTPNYMAPEQAMVPRQPVGPAADVYALGAILYELLSGRPPFRGTTLMETLDQVRLQEPVPLGLAQVEQLDDRVR